MGQINDFFSSNAALVFGVLAIAGVVLAILLAMQMRNVTALMLRIDALTRGVDGKNLEAVLNQHLVSVFRVAEDIDEASSRIGHLEESALGHFSRLGLIRFNPFLDTGGNQSYALALLDGRGNGFVISSLHSRTGTRMYAKAVKNGQADTALSDEETQAIETALGRKKRRPGATAVRKPAAATPAAAPAAPSGEPRPPVVDAPGS